MSIFSKLHTVLRIAIQGTNIPAGKVARVTTCELKRPEGIRRYLIALPSKTSSEKRPLVIILHGSGSSAAQVLGMAFPTSPLSVWLEIGEREQVVILAPDGNQSAKTRAWNDSYAEITSNPKTDDIGLICALIDTAITENAVDPARVYLMGVSKGGMMAYRAATEIAHKLAAFSSVLAAMPVSSNCGSPKSPLSALIIANTNDPMVRYQGGKFSYLFSMHAPALSIEESVMVWRNLSKLPKEASITPIPHRHSNAPTTAARYVWGANPSGPQVSFIKIDNGGHTEPSERKRYPWLLTRIIGEQNADFEVAEEAWAFFKDKRNGLFP